MALSLKPEHFKDYKDIALLLMKYGHSDLVTQAGLDHVLPTDKRGGENISSLNAEELADDLEKMGPIYVKLGQVLSSRGDLLPAPYIKALARLQDKIEPFSYAEVQETIEQELGVRISKAFLEFDEKPLASASLGQVHRAILRNGRHVAVKVQRPGIRKRVAEELEALVELAAFADHHTEVGRKYHLSDIIDEFKRNLGRELDYQQEARNLTHFADDLQKFHLLVVPRPVLDYCSSRVLTMDYIDGKKITALSPLKRMEINGRALAEELFRAYLKQILIDGFFHADPHPGNVLITADGRVGLIDLGMVGNVSPTMQDRILKLLIAVTEGQGDQVADLAIKTGETTEHFEEPLFRRHITELVAQQQNVTVENINIGRVMLDLTKVAGDTGVRLPPELTMLSKTLLNLDELGRVLNPDFNPNEAIKRNTAEIMRERMLKSVSLGNVLNAALEAQEFAQEMPGRVNKILDALAKNQLKLHVEAFDEGTLIEGFQKVANRITTGLVLAALIIGAAMLMRVPTTFQLFGYPGLAMLCFLAAAGGGAWLIITIMLNDRAVRQKSR